MKDKNVLDKRDRNKIDMNDSSEVEYVHSKFPHLKNEQVYEAIISRGPSRPAVMDYLKKQSFAC